MPKLRKLRRKQKFQFNRNRKRVQKTQEKTLKKNIKIQNDVLKENWDRGKAVKENLDAMGLAYDPNRAVVNKNFKAELIEKAEGKPSWPSAPPTAKSSPSDAVKRLQEQASSPENKVSTFRFNQEQITFVTYMMDKHGDDFRAMARDAKNHYQETPKQIRQKVLKFCSIPAHYVPYMRDRGMLDQTEVEEEQDDS